MVETRHQDAEMKKKNKGGNGKKKAKKRKIPEKEILLQSQAKKTNKENIADNVPDDAHIMAESDKKNDQNMETIEQQDSDTPMDPVDSQVAATEEKETTEVPIEESSESDMNMTATKQAEESSNQNPAKEPEEVDDDEFTAHLSTEVKEALETIRSGEKFSFDKANALMDITAILDTEDKTPNVVNSEIQKRMKDFFREMRAIRVTEAESLLSEAKRYSTAKSEAQNKLIKKLQDQLVGLQKKFDSVGSEEQSLREENLRLKEQNAKLASDLARFLESELNGEKTVTSSETTVQTISKDDDVETEDLDTLLQVYAQLTSMKLKWDGDAVNCTMLNKRQRRAIKYQFDFSTGDDRSICFRPTGNLEYFPQDLRQAQYISAKELPKIHAQITQALLL